MCGTSISLSTAELAYLFPFGDKKCYVTDTLLPYGAMEVSFQPFFFVIINNLFTIHIHTLITILKHQSTLLTILHLLTLHYNTCLMPI